MSENTIRKLIKQGKYDTARTQLVDLPPVMQSIYQSRIAELTGYFERALDLAKEGRDRAKSHEDHVAAAVAQAYVYWRLFDFDQGHLILDSVVPHLEELQFEKSVWRGTYYNIRGLLYWKDDQLEEALDAFRTALIIREELGGQSDISYTLNNLGNTYLKFKDHERARQYYSDAYQIREVLQHKPALAASANSFGRLHDDLGNHSKALDYHQDCLRLWNEVGNDQFIGKSYRFLAINAYYRHEIVQSQEYFEQSDTYFRSIGNTTDLSTNEKLQKKFRN